MGLSFPHGYINSEWQKLGFIFSFSDVLNERVDSLAAAAGNHDLDFGTVPTGEIWVLTNLSLFGISAGFTSLQLLVNDSGTLTAVHVVQPPTTNITYTETKFVAIKAGLNFTARMSGAAIGDRLIATILGYKMYIAL